MTDLQIRKLTRRTFLGGSAAMSGMVLLNPWELAIARSLPQAGQIDTLRATDPEGIDLILDRQALRVDGRPTSAITINGSIPGPIIRMREGEEALIRVHNKMDESTSIHWHGILLPYNMDGVPGISYPGIAPGETFTYRYRLRQNGTYWYHSHTGLQEQLGHYGQLIVETADQDPVDYDVEHTVVLSDWTYQDPHTVLRNLKTMEGYYNFQRPTLANLDEELEATGQSLAEVIGKRLDWRWMRMDPTDIADVTGATYTYLMNGRSARENPTFLAKPGQRVRLRITNASTMTFYDFRIPGLPMTIVQADGQDLKPVETDELRIAVAETYDVVVTMPNEGACTLFAETMDRSGYTRGTLAPHQGMSAQVPPRRRRPMLGMEDMGMMMSAKSMDMKNKHGHKMNSKNLGRGSGHRSLDHNASARMNGQERKELKTGGLPDRLMHGTEEHGPASITMAMSHYRQLDDPGIGLGDDGWRVLTYGQLRSLNTPSDRRPPSRQFDLHLTGNMHKYIWGFDGKKWSESNVIRFEYGERLRINMRNDTMMSHPIHLHGMWMDLYTGSDYDEIPRKHTVNVQPAELLTVDITASAPGQWAFHCHLLYHMKMGMFRTVAVVRSLDGGAIHADA